MRKLCIFISIALVAALALPMAASEAATQLAKKKTLTPPPFFFTQRKDNSVAASVKRGKKIFRDVGCVGCHPRGRTSNVAIRWSTYSFTAHPGLARPHSRTSSPTR